MSDDTPARLPRPPDALGVSGDKADARSAFRTSRPEMPTSATLIEVGLRDGLQAESAVVPTEAKVEAVEALIAAGVRHLQVASFVHPTRVPQMADAEALLAAVPRDPGATYSGLALNARGVERAAAAGVDVVDLSMSTNDAHSQRNAGMSVAESRDALREMVRLARQAGLGIRAGLQCVWGCGADGPTPAARVRELAETVLGLGVDQLSLADSTGEANPATVARMLDALRPLADEAGADLVLHLHDTRGAGLANVVEALRWGVTRFDTAIGGMGGCPFIPGATGNIPTEDTALLLHGMGVRTGLDVARVAAVTRSLEARLGHAFSGRTYSLLADPATEVDRVGRPMTASPS